MSRSYKFPTWKDNDGAGRKRWYKKHYNRKIRRTREYDMPSGNAYRKMNDP